MQTAQELNPALLYCGGAGKTVACRLVSCSTHLVATLTPNIQCQLVNNKNDSKDSDITCLSAVQSGYVQCALVDEVHNPSLNHRSIVFY